MTKINTNKCFFWRDSVIYIGESFDPRMHSHHAVQCCIALNGMMKIKWDASDDWHQCTAAVIGAGVPHSITCPEGPVCLLYLEKHSDNYQAILDYHCNAAFCDSRKSPFLLTEPIPQALSDELKAVYSFKADPKIANGIRHSCLRLFGGFIAKSQSVDPRIGLLLKLMRLQPFSHRSGRDWAENIRLSESRMQHLFKMQIGIPIRRYILWTRLRHVIELAVSGMTLTEAAHTSGFSDSAHFSRTFKSMFGITPSLLLSPNSGLFSLFCDEE